MTPEERAKFWTLTVASAKQWDPRLMRALLSAVVLRHGRLSSCEAGCHTFPIENITIEELHNITEHYDLGMTAPEPGVLQLLVIDRGYTSEHTKPKFE